MRSDAKLSIEIETIFRQESPRVLATLIRLLGDIDLAEDAMQESFAVALRKWPSEGIPTNPRAWLVSTGRFKGIDYQRRTKRLQAHSEDLFDIRESFKDLTVADDQLRLIFVCCHPSIPRESQIALTLREVCGLTTDEIARAFLSTSGTIAQRIVRAKSKIRQDKIPYEIPDVVELPERLNSVLRVIYLVFNEGYYASSGPVAVRHHLSSEAIRLGRLLAQLMPHSEILGTVALMLLHESRRTARISDSGDLILLDHQDRAKWDKALIFEGIALIAQARSIGQPGLYSLQAAIAAVHASSPTPNETDWNTIVQIYDQLLTIDASPVIQLNRAVAVSMVEGPSNGLDLVENILTSGELSDYALAHTARADFLRQLNRNDEARAAYTRALHVTRQEPERRFLLNRLAEVSDVG